MYLEIFSILTIVSLDAARGKNGLKPLIKYSNGPVLILMKTPKLERHLARFATFLSVDSGGGAGTPLGLLLTVLLVEDLEGFLYRDNAYTGHASQWV